MGELEAATNDELLAELARRFDSTLFAAVKVAPGDENRELLVVEYTGGLVAARGLAVEAADRLSAEAAAAREVDPGEEP